MRNRFLSLTLTICTVVFFTLILAMGAEAGGGDSSSSGGGCNDNNCYICISNDTTNYKIQARIHKGGFGVEMFGTDAFAIEWTISPGNRKCAEMTVDNNTIEYRVYYKWHDANGHWYEETGVCCDEDFAIKDGGASWKFVPDGEAGSCCN